VRSVVETYAPEEREGNDARRSSSGAVEMGFNSLVDTRIVIGWYA